MIKLKIKLDDKYLKSVAYVKPLTIREIIGEKEISESQIMGYVINNTYVSINQIIDKDETLNLITRQNLSGFRIYQDTAIFILMKAFYNLYRNNANLVVEHSLGDGIYCEPFGKHENSNENAEIIKNEMNKIIAANIKIESIKMSLDNAEDIFKNMNRKDVTKNLSSYNKREITIYKCGNYYDYYIRHLSDETGMMKVFELVPYKNGYLLRIPVRDNTELNENLTSHENLFNCHQEYDKWLNILKLHNASALNEAIDDYKIQELIQIEEALHENKIVKIAENIASQKDVKIVLIAGPSSSGKTTFSKRLAIQMRVNGIYPHVIGMDDYFLSRTLTPKKENGDFDFENINALDIKLLNSHLAKLLNGEEVEIPKYNFIKGEPERNNHFVQLHKNDIIIMEGIHGINEKLTESIPRKNKVKIYISALNQLNVDEHNRIPSTDGRKIRRIVRDNLFRGYTANDTLERWEQIREGEDNNIFPFQENADFMFNSSLTYELSVLKKHAIPLLQNVSKFSPVYLEAKRLIRLLNHFLEISDNLIPTNSILKEFITGSIFRII